MAKTRMVIQNYAAAVSPKAYTVPANCQSWAIQAVGGTVLMYVDGDAVNYWTITSGSKESFEGETLRMIKGQILNLTIADKVQIRYVPRYRTEL